MITINPATAFLLYLGLTVGVLLISWTRHARTNHDIVPLEKAAITCEYCTHGYIAKKEEHVTRCPECDSLNGRPS